MSKDYGNKTATLTAHAISDIFSPLASPTLGVIVAFWLTRLHYLPLQLRIWVTIGVCALTAIVPMIAIALLMKLNKVSDMAISDRRQRPLPYSTTLVCYILAAIYLYALKAPGWLVAFLIGATIVVLVSLLITHFWRISAHCGGIGGLAAMMVWLAYFGLIESHPLMWVSIVFGIVGLVGWARLYLNHHTVAQVFAGMGVSFGLVYATITVYQLF